MYGGVCERNEFFLQVLFLARTYIRTYIKLSLDNDIFAAANLINAYTYSV